MRWQCSVSLPVVWGPGHPRVFWVHIKDRHALCVRAAPSTGGLRTHETRQLKSLAFMNFQRWFIFCAHTPSTWRMLFTTSDVGIK